MTHAETRAAIRRIVHATFSAASKKPSTPPA